MHWPPFACHGLSAMVGWPSHGALAAAGAGACLLLDGIVDDTPLRLGSVALISTYVRSFYR